MNPTKKNTRQTNKKAPAGHRKPKSAPKAGQAKKNASKAIPKETVESKAKIIGGGFGGKTQSLEAVQAFGRSERILRPVPKPGLIIVDKERSDNAKAKRVIEASSALMVLTTGGFLNKFEVHDIKSRIGEYVLDNKLNHESLMVNESYAKVFEE